MHLGFVTEQQEDDPRSEMFTTKLP